MCAHNSLISLSRYRRCCSSWKFNLLNLFGNSNILRFYIKWKLKKKKPENFHFEFALTAVWFATMPAHIFYSHFNNIFAPFETKGIIFQCFEMFELINMSIYLGLNPNSVLRRLRASEQTHRNELLSVLVSVKLVVSTTASTNILFYHQKLRHSFQKRA